MKWKLYVMAALAAVPISCDRGGARIDGHIIGAADEPLYLELVMPGAEAMVDTTRMDSKGKFSFRLTPPDGQPTIYNLRYGNDMIPLLVSPGERVRVMSLNDLEHGYKVSGSGESELVWELHGILTDGAKALDSLSGLLAMSNPDGPERELLTKAWLDKYYKTKREHIGFVVRNSSSLAAVYALYQRLPGDETLFSDTSDYVYYQMVADSVQSRYPDSRYVVALEKEVESHKAALDIQNLLTDGSIEEVNHPDLDLPNMYGQKTRLSSLAGKVIVLDFWSAASPEGRLNNAEMRELWDSYQDEGFVIYQVSLDTSKPLWISTVQEQKLPWVTVCDFRGMGGTAPRLYNIGGVPANFVIDREGIIVGKNLYGEALAAKIKGLL